MNKDLEGIVRLFRKLSSITQTIAMLKRSKNLCTIFYVFKNIPFLESEYNFYVNMCKTHTTWRRQQLVIKFFSRSVAAGLTKRCVAEID